MSMLPQGHRRPPGSRLVTDFQVHGQQTLELERDEHARRSSGTQAGTDDAVDGMSCPPKSPLLNQQARSRSRSQKVGHLGGDWTKRGGSP